MSKCDIFLHLDKPRFRQLEEITGEVRVRVNKDCKCKELVLSTRWLTKGKGDLDAGDGHNITLFRGSWKAGKEYKYPFSMATPAGPCTYDGKLIFVNWTLKAQADIPWAIDPKDKKPFSLGPGPVSNYFAGRSFRPPTAQTVSLRQTKQTILGIIITSIVSMSILAHLLNASFSMTRLLLEIFAIAVGVGLAAFSPMRRLLASRKLGKVSVYLPSYMVHPGGELPLTVTVEGGKGQVIKKVFTTLKAVEAATYEQTRSMSDDHRRSSVTRHNTVFSRRFTSSVDGVGRRAMSKGGSMRKDIRVSIPEDAAPSFKLGHNRLTWYLSVQLEIPDWPDWEKTMMIAVIPDRSYKPPATMASRMAPAQKGDTLPEVEEMASVAAASVADAIPALAPLTPGRPPAPLKPGAPPAGFSPPKPVASRVSGEKVGQRFVVAVCRWARPPAEVAQSLASHFGMTAYDLSMQLSGPLPLIVGQDMDAEEAGGLVEILMEQGHRVITLDMGLVPEPEALITVRDFRLREQGLLVLDERKVKQELAWSEIQALIRAVHKADPKAEKESSLRVPIGNRSTGGKIADAGQPAREQVLYLVPKDARRTLLFRENRVRYQGLGSRMAQTKQQSFLTLVDILRKLAPKAFFDERLCRSVYTEGQSAMKAVKKSSGSSDNHSSVTDLMVQVLLAAKQQGQL
ncbi:MAG: hypothetical protein JRF33_19950 [Deltaproteobacteria bacterium]|nr:hypothetical protein [Deltaproteobacteria bacterium]